MKNTVVMQECSQCNKRFPLRYFADGTYEFVSEPCDCESAFNPIEGKPSITEWIERTRTNMENSNSRYTKLKEALFDWGNDYIEEFLGYSTDVEGMSRSEIEELMDEAYDEMDEEKLEEFYEKFLID